MAMTYPLGGTAQDSEQWWQAYQLAENDQDAELGKRAAAGDDHARWQLASWLSDRGRTEEAIEVIRPLADAGDDVADLWLARWLAERDHDDELRRRAESGDYYALVELAKWLAAGERLDEVRDLVVRHRQQLEPWLSRGEGTGDMRLVRMAAELGDEAARQRVEAWLGRLRRRAETGDTYARDFLAENPDWLTPF
jgi:hypothetical protein